MRIFGKKISDLNDPESPVLECLAQHLEHARVGG